MKVSASMESLWVYIQSLSLSKRNQKWLAERLMENVEADKACEDEEEYISKEEILAGIAAGLEDLKAGRKQSFEDFIKELDDEV